MVRAWELLEKVREKKPLIHHITNWVTIYDCANITRTFGALPVMAHASEEVEEMTSISGALVLNIGTLTEDLVDSMLLASKRANEKNIPIVLDAVGVGATTLRTKKAFELMDKANIDIIKGNFAEIGVLAGAEAEVRGVEAVSVEGSSKQLAQKLAMQKNCVVVVTGKEDIVSDRNKTLIIKNGHDMMGKIVGTGCMVSSVIGSFAAVERDFAMASASALVCFGIAGEIAGKDSRGPGSYKENLYDAVFNLSKSQIEKMEKIVEKK